jgi:GT2 family glycosyltransferase
VTAPVRVCVVSWNTRALLDDCLNALHGAAAEVHVVDNASADGSAQLVRDRHPWAMLTASDTNLGFGPAVNLAAKDTTQPWIACANADTRLHPGALDVLLAAAQPADGALAPRLVLADGRTQPSLMPFPTIPQTLQYNLGLKRWPLDQDRPRTVPWAIGAFLVLRREAFHRLGGFDERQWLYAEDLDLGYRLRQAGWTTRYVPDARVTHHASAATGQAFGDATEARWQAATYAWLARTRGPARTRATAAINVAGALARAAAAPRDSAARDRARRWARLHRVGLRPRDIVAP